jgi:excisionase family DNA binding protein
MDLAGAVSVREAAELLGVEERAVRLMAASGDIEASQTRERVVA